MAEKGNSQIRGFLRAQEHRFAPKLALERESYEHRNTLLQDPSSEAYKKELARVKNRVDGIVPANEKPLRETFEGMAPTNPALFKDPSKQAISSDHNIPHVTTVAALSVLDATRRFLEDPSIQIEPLEKIQKKAWIVGMLHDVRRGGDVAASIPPFVLLHGWSGAQMTPRMMQDLQVEPALRADRGTVKEISQAMRHHDVDFSRNSDNPYLHIIKMVDRATIGRLFDSKHPLIQLTASYLAAKRMRAYPTHAKERVDTEYMDALIDIASTVDILTHQRVRLLQQEGKATRESVYTATLDTLEELGILAKVEEGQTDPHVVSLSRRTLPTAA